MRDASAIGKDGFIFQRSGPSSSRVQLLKRYKEAGRRLFLREYAPLAAWLATWAAITAAVGVKGAALLLAASQLTSGIRSLFLVDVRAPLVGAFRRGGRLDAAGWRTVWSFEIAALLLSLGTMYALASAVARTEYAAISEPLLVMALGLPAIYAGPLFSLVAARHGDLALVATIRAAVGTALVVASALLGFGLVGLAAALMSRWWAGLIASLILVRIPPRAQQPELAAGGEVYRPRWQQIAIDTRERGQRRIAYRLSKIVFSGLLGPFGSVIARTLRGTRQLQRFQLTGWSMVAALVGIAVVASGGAAGLLLIEGHHVKLIVVGALVRLACIALGTLLWTAIARGHAPEQIDLDDEDFD